MELFMENAGQLKIFFFGDSICFGQGVDVSKGWVSKVAQSLGKSSSKMGVDTAVFNPSINGNTTRMALERMPHDIQTQEPDLVIIQFGMNDANYWDSDRGHPRVSPLAFVANLKEIINRAFNSGARQVILHTNHISGRNKVNMTHTSLTYQQSNEYYNTLIRNVAKELNGRVLLNDLEKAFFNYIRAGKGQVSDLLLPDLLHLSEKGHELYFETVCPLVTKVVEELACKQEVAAIGVN
jgi:acyl-CoA thioesterase-1